MMRKLLILSAFLLASCVASAPKKDTMAVPVASTGIVGGPITATALAPIGTAPLATAPATKPATLADAPKPETPVEPTPEAAAKPVPAPAPEPEPEPRAVSQVEYDCIKGGGYFGKAGSGDLKACFTRTKDAGKSCDKESDCQGYCLAKSRSCAPITPLFGCNEILQDNGVRVTLCLD